MGYSIDLNTISIEQYMEKLKRKNLIPSRMILKENLDKRFSYFKKIGVTTVSELLSILKKKEKFKDLSKLKSFSEDYLTILLRELKSIQSKPIKLGDFKWIPAATIKKLEYDGIKNTQQLYDKVLTRKNRKDLSNRIGVSEKEILKLTKLTDLSSIQWVNSTFARVLYETGYDTVEKVKKVNYETLYKKIKEINKEKSLYKGNIGLNDMKICIEAAKEVSLDIEY
jgi:hypothetical protein